MGGERSDHCATLAALEDFACYAKKKITAFTATLEHSKNTKITTLQMTTAFQRIDVSARIYKHHFMSEIAEKQENIL